MTAKILRFPAWRQRPKASPRKHRTAGSNFDKWLPLQNNESLFIKTWYGSDDAGEREDGLQLWLCCLHISRLPNHPDRAIAQKAIDEICDLPVGRAA